MKVIQYCMMIGMASCVIMSNSLYAKDMPNMSKNEGGTAYMLNEGMRLKSDELTNLTSSALQGDKEAAHRIARYYEGIELDHQKAMYWYQIAAENGGTVNHYNYGVMLANSSDSQDKIRARYWLSLALKEGDEHAADEIKQLDDPNYMKNKIKRLLDQRAKQQPR